MSEPTKGEEPKPPGALEKIATVISVLLIASLLAVLLWDATHPNAPPAFEVTTGEFEPAGSVLRLPVHVSNTGDESAKSVVVHVELTQADTAVSESDVTIDWLPGRSKRDAIAVFSREDAKSAAGVRAEVRGYAVP
jgi:uncharacterized protein (TIGR02588 family)